MPKIIYYLIMKLNIKNKTKLLISIIFCLLTLNTSHSIDELNFRKLFSKKKSDINYSSSNLKYKYLVSSKYYSIDLDNDGIQEYFKPFKKDGEDWFEIYKRSLRVVFKGRLLSLGPNSKIYKIKYITINKNVKSLILFFQMGRSKGFGFHSSTQLYFINIINNDLTAIKIQKGPRISIENMSLSKFYFQRSYPVHFTDLNNDGTKDLLIKYKNISRVYYFKNSKWNIL
jgi:hypothetical protein